MTTIFKSLDERREAIALLRDIDARGVYDSRVSVRVKKLLKSIDDSEAASSKVRSEKAKRVAARAARDKATREKFEIAPRSSGGCDHGSEGIVLLRKGDQKLVWRRGSKYFSGIGMQSYAPADLQILMAGQTMPIRVTDNHGADLRGEKKKSARLTSALVLSHAEIIDTLFGKGAAKKASKLERTEVLP